MSFREEYELSINQPETFWAEKAKDIAWFTPPKTILSKDDRGVDRWFADGELNTCFLALDHQVERGRGPQTALIYDSPVTGQKKKYSYQQLLDEVALFAGVLENLGVRKSDSVLIYMPMVPEAVIAMLAAARLGAVHSVVFGGFAPNELKVRINDAAPRVILTASCGLEAGRIIPYKPIVDEAIATADTRPDHVVVLQRPQQKAGLDKPGDHDWQTLLADAKPAACVAVNALDPLYILYTSGTTGRPKGIVMATETLRHWTSCLPSRMVSSSTICRTPTLKN